MSGRSPPLLFALLSVSMLVAGASCGPQDARSTPDRKAAEPRSVQVAPVGTMALPDIVTAYGSLAAEERVEFGFRHAGQLGRLTVDIGSRVKRGEEIAALDTTTFELVAREAEASVRQARVALGLPAEGDDDSVDPESTPRVRQARAVLREATVSRVRAEELVKTQLAPSSVYDTALAAYSVAESRVQQALNDVCEQEATLAQRRIAVAVARQRLRESVLIAPFDGLVAARHVSEQEFLSVGTPVVTLLRVDPLRLRLMVPERDAGALEIGQTVRFTVDGVSGEHEGRIVRLSPEIRRDDRILLAEAEVRNAGRLRPGQFCRATIEVSAPEPRVVVPRAAIVSFAGVDKVFIVVDGKAAARTVETGRAVGDLVEIEQGVAATATVVLAPGDLIDGQPLVVTAEGQSR